MKNLKTFDQLFEGTKTETSWTKDNIEEFLDSMGQEETKFISPKKGISFGAYGKVEFNVLESYNGELRIHFENSEMMKHAFNALSKSLSNPYEFLTREDEMPKTIAVRFTDNMDEGIISDIGKSVKKFFGVKNIYRIAYTVTEPEKEDKDKKEKDYQAPRQYTMNVTLKAKNAEEAHEKFMDMWDDKVKGKEPMPTVSVDKIRRTDKHDRKHIELL